MVNYKLSKPGRTEIETLSVEESRQLLAELNFGHLACCSNDQPYVVPIHFAFDGQNVFIYTTEGKKTDILDENPAVCLQAEIIENNSNWKSVMVFGKAKRLTEEEERQKAIDKILETNPNLTPAISIRWIDMWVKENIEAIYCIEPDTITGRRAFDRK